ncbi:MAG: response regulator PleD [Methanoregula sp. PtaU1.Bin051]|nr:MAG: response regulator PleD [Methanoregula sp. PtaU1.Bin051]
MRGTIIVLLIASLLLLSCTAYAQEQGSPDYEKIHVIQLKYEDGTYAETGQHVQYGKAPNPALMSGNLRAVITDPKGREISTFFLMEPGIAIGDSIDNAETERPILRGYLERSTAADMVITLPFMPGMHTFSLYSVQTGTHLVSVDLSPSTAAFCLDFPGDPDCLPVTSQGNTAAQEQTSGAAAGFPGIYIQAAALALLIVAILSSYILMRSRAKTVAPARQKVLVVDDEPLIVDLVTVVLQEQNYSVQSATGGRECLEMIRKMRDLPDVILLDIMMQPMDGWQTLRQLKADARTKNIPVLMLTGKQLTAAEAKEFNICIEDYLMKPFGKNKLDTAIKSILHRRKNMQSTLALARKAGVSRDMYCEFAKLSRHVDVNRKMIGLLQQTYGVPDPDRAEMTEADTVIWQLSTNTREKEDRLEQLRREISSAFLAKGYPVPSLYD